MKLAPSILSADFAELAAEVERVHEVADLLHVDVMDGHFVPNLTIGPPVVAALRRRTELFLDCHLMVDNPGVLLADFAAAGDRKSTRLNSSHANISYAVSCLKKKKEHEYEHNERLTYQ